MLWQMNSQKHYRERRYTDFAIKRQCLDYLHTINPNIALSTLLCLNLPSKYVEEKKAREVRELM